MMKRRWWRLLGCVAGLSGWLWMDGARAAFRERERLTEDLGHHDWQEVAAGYFIAEELLYQRNNLVVFDMFIDPDLAYGRWAGDCGAMQVKRLRGGGISGSEVVFSDLSAETEIQDVWEGEPLHTLLVAACEQRAVRR